MRRLRGPEATSVWLPWQLYVSYKSSSARVSLSISFFHLHLLAKCRLFTYQSFSYLSPSMSPSISLPDPPLSIRELLTTRVQGNRTFIQALTYCTYHHFVVRRNRKSSITSPQASCSLSETSISITRRDHSRKLKHNNNGGKRSKEKRDGVPVSTKFFTT
jgi:hypothetical protein